MTGRVFPLGGEDAEAFDLPGVRVFETLLILGWWFAWWLFNTGQWLAFSAATGQALSIGSAAARVGVAAATWVLITFLVFALARRYPLDRRPRTRAVVVHVFAGFALAMLEVVVGFVVMRTTGWVEDQPFRLLLLRSYPGDLIYYWLFVGVAHGLNYYRRFRQREAHAAHLRTRLAEAELHLLKSQLHPHFLFNTLHAISALMHRDVRAAERMLSRLSELLRVALDYSGTDEVTLEEELAFLEPYVEIERVRLGDRLSVEFDIQPTVRDARVPHMILQPLVENAIRHGIAPRAAPGRIRVSARGRRNMLDLEVLDDGPGMPPGPITNGGHGLAITRARLEQLYGEDFLLQIRNAAGGGFRVSLTIPFRPAIDLPAAEEVDIPWRSRP